MKFDIYEEITNRIIDEMKKGNIPWQKPWVGNALAVKHVGGKPYSLLNQFLLGEPGEYLSFKQCQDEGGKIKKGAKARMVVFWKMLVKERTDADGKVVMGKDGKPIVDTIPLLRYMNVFHIRDCEGIKPRYTVELPIVEPFAAHEKAESVLQEYIKRSGVAYRETESDEAYYSPSQDMISLPLRRQFHSQVEFYSTAFHESVHSTGHTSRLNRLDKRASFGKEEYSKEELVAEIGSATLLFRCGLETPESLKNNAAYVQSWLKALKNDQRMIVSAAGKAEKAVDYILGEGREE